MSLVPVGRPGSRGDDARMWFPVAILLVATAGCAREAIALPVRPVEDGTRFQRLDAVATGLEFRNELRRENILAYVYTGAGVAVRDYNADGLPDVYPVFENNGGALVPRPLPRAAQISTGNGIGVADFDGDGILDLVIAHNSYSPEPETGPIAGGLGEQLLISLFVEKPQQRSILLPSIPLEPVGICFDKPRPQLQIAQLQHLLMQLLSSQV